MCVILNRLNVSQGFHFIIVEPPNKGHVGDSMHKSAILSFV